MSLKDASKQIEALNKTLRRRINTKVKYRSNKARQATVTMFRLWEATGAVTWPARRPRGQRTP